MNAETPPGLVAAARIAAGDDRTRYDGISMALHWLTVALVLTQFALSQLWGFFPCPSRHLMIVAHMPARTVLGAVLLAGSLTVGASRGDASPTRDLGILLAPVRRRGRHGAAPSVMPVHDLLRGRGD